MGMTKDMHKYLQKLRNQGYTLVPANHHCKIYSGDTLVATAGGGQSLKSIRNLQCEIRKFERQLSEGDDHGTVRKAAG